MNMHDGLWRLGSTNSSRETQHDVPENGVCEACCAD